MSMRIIVCGCSFSAIANLPEYTGSHWSERLADMMGAELINFGRQGISNAAIRVQINEAIKLKPDWIFVGSTTEDRVEVPVKRFMAAGTSYDPAAGLKNFNYNNGQPYNLLSETIFSIIDRKPHAYRTQQISEALKLGVENYAAFMHDVGWKSQCDRWIINSGLWAMHDAGIKFLYNPYLNAQPIESDMPDWFVNKYFVTDNNLSFGHIGKLYPHEPDPGYHTSPEGQIILAQRYYELVQTKLKEEQ